MCKLLMKKGVIYKYNGFKEYQSVNKNKGSYDRLSTLVSRFFLQRAVL